MGKHVTGAIESKRCGKVPSRTSTIVFLARVFPRAYLNWVSSIVETVLCRLELCSRLSVLDVKVGSPNQVERSTSLGTQVSPGLSPRVFLGSRLSIARVPWMPACPPVTHYVMPKGQFYRKPLATVDPDCS